MQLETEIPNVAEATKDRMESDKLETVAKAVEFYMELVEAAQEILNRKKSFINEHAPEVPSLIRKATRLRQTAARLQRQVFELLRKAPSGLREKQVKKLVSVILKHKSLEKQHNAVAAQLAQYNPDNPYNGMQPFPSTNYRLPSFIRTKLQQAEQVEQREVKKINEFQGLAA